MTVTVNRRIVLAAHPDGEPRAEDFRLEEAPVPELREGHVLLRTIYLSLDPYMRGRMNTGPYFVPPVELGNVMEAEIVGQVVESRASGFLPGEYVLAYGGWQEYSTAHRASLEKLDRKAAPLSTALGILGVPGLAAYTGLLNIGQPKPGETVVVAAASGAVGSVVGQIAKLRGCRAVGIAGGEQKCKFVLEELGLDACIDHRSPGFSEELKDACPNGIDVYFENVGGKIFEAVLPLLNLFGRVPVCGLVAQYNTKELPPGPNQVPLAMTTILQNRLTFRGFLVGDFASQKPEFLREMGALLREGRVKYREDIVDGIDNAVRAFQGLLRGENFGKLLVRVAPEAV
jgi:NADPH-dependent curcumin reductase CurA